MTIVPPVGAGAAAAERLEAPWQNPWVESYGGRMRDELLAMEQFDTLLEAQVLVSGWREGSGRLRQEADFGGIAGAGVVLI